MSTKTKTVVRAPKNSLNEYVMSDETPDRYGDIVEAKGWDLSNFKKNPIALFGHSSNFVIGKWHNVRVENKELRGHLELLPQGVSPRVDEIRACVDAGILRAVSVGFKPHEYAYIDEGKRAVKFIRSELLECSIVAIPANPNALEIAKGLNLSDDALSLVFGEQADEAKNFVRKTISIQPRKKPVMNIGQKIKELEALILKNQDSLTEILTRSDDLSDAENAEVTKLTDDITESQKRLEALKRTEKALGASSESVQRTQVPSDGGTLVIPPRRTVPAEAAKLIKPVDYVFRAAAVRLLAKVENKALDIVRRERYGDDEKTKLITDMVNKAASAPATTTTTGWAAELVATVMADFVDTLMPSSVYPGLSRIGGRFSFGRAGTVSIPARSATPTIAGSFVAQGAAIPVRQAAFTAVTLTPRKMSVISTFTREIAEHSTPSIEQLIRQAMQEDTAVAIDTVLIDATAASTTRPAGLRNGVSVTAATSGGGIAALVGDLKGLLGALITSLNGNVRQPVWLMNPINVVSAKLTQDAGGDFPFAADLERGTLLGFPVLQSSTITAGMVILVDAADFFSALGDEPRFDVSDQATLHMEDTSPTALSATGTPNTVAAPIRSLWQTDTIGIRMMLDMNWAMRRTGAIAWTQSVTW